MNTKNTKVESKCENTLCTTGSEGSMRPGKGGYLRDRTGIAEVRWKLIGEGSFQSLLDVMNKILGVLNTDRQSDEIVTDSEEFPLSGRNASVGHLSRNLGKTLHAAEGLGQGKELQRSQELVGLVDTPLNPERDYSTVWETGITWVRVVLPVVVDKLECVWGEGAVCQSGLRM